MTTAIALLGPDLLTLSPQNVVVTVAGATLAAVAGGSIRALEVEAERRRSANAALTRAHADLEVALADNVRLTDRLVEEARQAGTAAKRTRLAAEIHDTLAAGLSGILAQLEALDAELPAGTGARNRVRTSIEVARESLQEARHSVGALREAGSVATDLPAAVQATADRVGDRFDLTVEVRVVGTLRPVATEVAETAVLAAREALTNVAKHAGAEHAYVTVSYLYDRVAVDISDDGHGQIGETGTHRGPGDHGLAIMTDRLQAIGGTIEVAAAPGQGTTVTLAVPYPSSPVPGHVAG